jgi:acetylornithine deacetylase/succinyl-diaminopimelate desuccinylase-like protein
MHLMAMFLLKRQNAPLKRDIILMANADEETGGGNGAQWVVDNHFDMIEAEFALNEGGTALQMNGNTLFFCATAEKGVAWMKLTALGRPGHGSMPHTDNPTLHISRAIERISKYSSPIFAGDTFRGFTNALCKVDSRGHLLKFISVPGLGRLILKLVKDDFIRVMVQTTITPTVIKGGVKTNVIPDKCELRLDSRILPGVTRDEIEKLVLDLADNEKMRLEFEAFTEASESPIKTELFSILEDVIARNFPDAAVSPLMLPGGTDSRFVRTKGIPAYGFIPIVLTRDDIASIHGDDEKISIENLSLGVRLMFHIAASTCL